MLKDWTKEGTLVETKNENDDTSEIIIGRDSKLPDWAKSINRELSPGGKKKRKLNSYQS